MAHPILNDDWSEYDERKLKEGQDKSKVSCEDRWELDYLLIKLKKYFPFVTDREIRTSISTCCKNRTSSLREDFLNSVISDLSVDG